MSNFDDWFKKKFSDLHEAICCGDLVANNYKKAIKKGFEAGAASRQAEVDALKEEVNEAVDTILKMQEKQGLLQNRIDKALKVLNDASPTMLDKKAIRILKGESK